MHDFSPTGRSCRRLQPAFLAQVLLALAVLCLAAAGLQRAAAQTINSSDGSIYSRFGVGELRSFSSAQAQAMGGGGLALRSLNYSGFANPALWSDQELTRLALGARYRQVSASNADGQTSRLASGTFQAVQFSFPLYAGKLGVGIGYRPYSRLEYRVRDNARFVSQPSIGQVRRDSTTYQIEYQGEGGLQEISGGFGYRFGDALALGARVNVVFGILENQRSTTFSDPRFAPTTLATRTRVAGVTGTAGALLSLSDVLREEDALTVGATFTLPAHLTGERTRTLGETLDRDTLALGNDGAEEFEERGDLTVPFGAALGVSYQPSARWTLVADGRYEPWSNAESDFETSLPGYNNLRDRVRASAGAELLPAGADRNAPFLRRTAYRLGGYYEQTYVGAGTLPRTETVRATSGVNVLAATAGLSLPTPLYGTRVDVGFEAGTRGTTDGGLVRDLFYGVSLSVNLGERWFQRRRLR